MAGWSPAVQVIAAVHIALPIVLIAWWGIHVERKRITEERWRMQKLAMWSKRGRMHKWKR